MSSHKDNIGHEGHIHIEILGGEVKILHHTRERLENSLGRQDWHVKGGRSARRNPKKPRA